MASSGSFLQSGSAPNYYGNMPQSRFDVRSVESNQGQQEEWVYDDGMGSVQQNTDTTRHNSGLTWDSHIWSHLDNPMTTQQNRIYSDGTGIETVGAKPQHKTRKEHKVSFYGHDSVDIEAAKSPLNTDDEAFDIEYTASTLHLRESNDGRTYLSIPDVFKYVTLGGRLNSVSLMSLGEYIREQNVVPNGKVEITKRNLMSGESKTIKINRYMGCNYGQIALACLQWAQANASQIAY